MRQSTVYTPHAKRVWVALCAVSDFSIRDVCCPHLRVSDEEALVCSQTVDYRKRIVLRSLLVCLVGNHQTSVVSKVLTKSETAVGVQVRQYLDVRIELGVSVSSLVEILAVVFCPPVFHVAVFVIMTTLVIESVSHFMTDYNTDSSIVECVVGCRVEEWNLQNTGREAYLVGRRIVVSIDGLWRHLPLILVYWLAHLSCDNPFVPESATLLDI